MNISLIKQVKRIVNDIVIEAAATTPLKEPIVAIMLEDISHLDERDKGEKLAIAIGNISTIGDYGYGLKPYTEVFEDVLLDNKHIDPKKILMGTYEQHYLKIRQNLPIYKYVSRLEENASILKQCPKVMEYLEKHNTVESYLNSQLIKTLEKIPEGDKLTDIPDDYKDTMRKKYLWIFKNINRISLSELREFLLQELNRYSSFNNNESSFFRRLISIYDFLAYKIK